MQDKVALTMSKGSTEPFLPQALLLEVAWEVCNQVGGIYTVIRTKVPSMMKRWSGRYCMIGPYLHKNIMAELEPLDDVADIFGQAAAEVRKRGYHILYAQWLVTGRPRVVLINPDVIEEKELYLIKYLLWKNHGIGTPQCCTFIDKVVTFAHVTKIFMEELVKRAGGSQEILAHFHEWMAALPILDIQREARPIKTIFTTHATQLGRHLAINSPFFYAHLPFFNAEYEAARFGIEVESHIEQACAQACDVFTTVSEVTAQECKHLLKRRPDALLPNGLNIQRFEALHEFQNLHTQYKEQIHEFVMAHFFHTYSFDLDKTIYFFTSGRYEFRNKGFDLTLDALASLNDRLKQENADVTVVMFLVTKREFEMINPDVLQSRVALEEIRQTCDAIRAQVGKRLFYESTRRSDNRLPDLNSFVDEYWKLRYRRTIQAWKSDALPPVVTHKLTDEANDEILNFLKQRNLLNHEADKVKIVYHPNFITSTGPLFRMDYHHFVRGCNLGIFPSYYDPWGYTPLECLVSGIPAVTSDLAGFGDYLLRHFPDHDKHGLYVVERCKHSYDWSLRQLTSLLHRFLLQSRRERITQRNNVEQYAALFDWENLIRNYNDVYRMCMNIHNPAHPIQV